MASTLRALIVCTWVAVGQEALLFLKIRVADMNPIGRFSGLGRCVLFNARRRPRPSIAGVLVPGLCVLALLMPLPAVSAPLGIEAALWKAVSTHPSVAVRRGERNAAQSGLEVANWQRYPSLSLQTGRDANDRYVTTTGVEQPLWTGGRITAGRLGAEARLDMAVAAVGEAEQAIMLQVASAFAEYGRARARLVEADNNVREHERLVAIMARRVESQVSPESDRVLAHSRLTQARSEYAQIEAAARRARISLEQALGQSIEDIAVPVAREPAVFTLDEARDAAVFVSPRLRRLVAEEEAASAEIMLQRSAGLPRLSLRYDRSDGGRVSDNRVYVALTFQSGAGLSVPAAGREAVARREAARSAREAGLRDVIEAVSRDWAEFESLQSQAGGLAEQVEATTQVFDSFLRQFSVGRKSWVDVLNAQRELTTARLALADVAWGVFAAAVRLQVLTGELTPVSLMPPNLGSGVRNE